MLCVMHKIFNESPSKRRDHERTFSTIKEDIGLFFAPFVGCMQNANVAKKAHKILLIACIRSGILVNISKK